MVIARIGCRAMPAATVRLPLAAFWADNSDVVAAVLSIVLALIVATLLDRYFARRGHRLAEAVTRGEVSPVLDTRLRFLRRLIYAVDPADRHRDRAVAVHRHLRARRALLASGAIAAAIIGFAARQTLANVIAGIMLAITQPLRVGDWVTFEDHYGVVEDVRLNFTVLRTAADERVIVIPNERLAAGHPAQRHARLDAPIGLDVSRLAAARRRRRARARGCSRRRTASTSPRSRRKGCASRSAATAVPPPQNGPRARPSCAPRAWSACAPRACSGEGIRLVGEFGRATLVVRALMDRVAPMSLSQRNRRRAAAAVALATRPSSP